MEFWDPNLQVPLKNFNYEAQVSVLIFIVFMYIFV